MIILAPEHLKALADAAEAAFPHECCGLVLGTGRRTIRVTRLLPAANLAPSGGTRFELDPRVRLAAERGTRGTAERVVGHYHSHPDGSALPSPTDLAEAWEPELIWLIVGVVEGQAVQVLAHRCDRERGLSRRVVMATTKKSACITLGIPT
jgi:proteasome lid subunit RPN8/RPN11